MRIPSPIQTLLSHQNAWWDYYEQCQNSIRESVVNNIVKILSCGLFVRGYKTYCCTNSECSHVKYVNFSCHARFCPTCGKKATDIWVNEQREILPACDWQHITFTMPDILWPLFKQSRDLLNELAKTAANTIMGLAKKKGVKPAVFTAMHTFGRDLKWHVHIHLSVTMGGLTLNNDQPQWKKIRFAKKAVMPMWRYAVIKMMRLAKKKGLIDVTHACLEVQYHKNWIVHFAKPTNNPWHTITYLGRYVKKPPISQARLKHYNGNVIFNYLNHKTGQYQTKKLSTHEFIDKLIQHIPDKGFRMIRYYGILANRVRGKLLPIVYELLDQTIKKPLFLGWATLKKHSFGIDPLVCILCQSKMKATSIAPGLKLDQLKKYHYELATRKAINMT